MKQLIFLLFIVLFLGSCLNMNDPKLQTEYIKCYNSFDKSLVNHIPDRLENNLILGSWEPLNYYEGSKNYAQISLSLLYSSNREFQKIKESFIKNAKFIGSTEDSCLVIIHAYGENTNLRYDSINCSRIIPIPENALYTYESDTVSDRTQKIELIVLDFESGNFFNSAKLESKEYLPVGLRNGYSKGLSINNTKQTINYWVIVW